MPLKVKRRRSTGALTIIGTIEFSDGSRQRFRRRAQSDEPRIAAEEAAALEARILRDHWHGKRRGTERFATAVLSYLKAAPRGQNTKDHLHRIMTALGDVSLSAVDQTQLDALRDKLFPHAAPATVLRNLLTPIRAVMAHAARRGWCDAVQFEIPRQPPGRTRYLLPEEADRLLDCAAPHLSPLLLFLIGTGARLSEAIELDWRDVDLAGGRAILWRTKGGLRRDLIFPPRLVIALANLPERSGAVFRWETLRGANGKSKRRVAYADRRRESGGHIRTGWAAALRRAGLDPTLTPHDLRHTWASWHYALYRDLLRLKLDG